MAVLLRLSTATEMIVQYDHAGHKVTEVTASMLEAQGLFSFFYKLLNWLNHGF